MKKHLLLIVLLSVVLFANTAEEDESAFQEIDKCNVIYEKCAKDCEESTQPDKCYEACDESYEVCVSKTEILEDEGNRD